MNLHKIKITEDITIKVWEDPESGRCWGEFSLPIAFPELGHTVCQVFNVPQPIETVREMLKNPANLNPILVEYLKWLGSVRAILDAQNSWLANQTVAIHNVVLDF